MGCECAGCELDAGAERCCAHGSSRTTRRIGDLGGAQRSRSAAQGPRCMRDRGKGQWLVSAQTDVHGSDDEGRGRSPSRGRRLRVIRSPSARPPLDASRRHKSEPIVRASTAETNRSALGEQACRLPYLSLAATLGNDMPMHAPRTQRFARTFACTQPRACSSALHPVCALSRLTWVGAHPSVDVARPTLVGAHAAAKPSTGFAIPK